LPSTRIPCKMWGRMWGKMMARHPSNKLTALAVKKQTTPGRYSDGNGLYLVVDPSGAKRWLQRLSIQGKRCDLGLGSTRLVSLDDAREQALINRRVARAGGDPIAERNHEMGLSMPFKDATLEVYKANLPVWSNEKHAKQWLATMENHVFPKIGAKPVGSIQSTDILAVLEPIWTSKPDTAKKIRQRLNMVINWARGKRLYTGDDPIKMAELSLPKTKQSKNHFKSLNYDGLPSLFEEIAASSATTQSKLALQFTILTCCRTAEVLNSTWDEIDLVKAIWTIPAERMKAGEPHIVPLSYTALKVLKKAHVLRSASELIFPSPIDDKPMSDGTMRKLLQKTLGVDATVHGFRSTFKDWASETTNHPNEVSEMALAHTIGNKTEAAYRRGDLLQKRRELMQDWSDFLCSKNSKVIRLEKGAAYGSHT